MEQGRNHGTVQGDDAVLRVELNKQIVTSIDVQRSVVIEGQVSLRRRRRLQAPNAHNVRCISVVLLCL